MIGVIICTSECNLLCKYCYEHTDIERSRCSLSNINDTFVKSLDKCEEYVDMLTKTANRYGRTTQIILHGGEPLLIRLENLEKLFKRIKSNHDVTIQIQTNGTLITQQTAELLNRYDVGVTISMDGPQRLHDEFRRNMGGFGTYKMILRAIDILKKNNVDVSALATITKKAVDYPEEIFAFFSNLNTDFSVNRCFPVDGKQGGISEYEYMSFLAALYDFYNSNHKTTSPINIPCFDRCIHDLKCDGGRYCYDPRISPYISVSSIPSQTYGFVAFNETEKFGSLLNYHSYAEQKLRMSTVNNVLKYDSSLKKSVIQHLCVQQTNDYLNAVKLGV